MKQLRAWFEQARLAFGRLTQREQLQAAGAAAALSLLTLLLIGYGVSHAIAQQKRRVHVKTNQLREVLELQGVYRARQQERAERLSSLGRSPVRLVSLVEDAARQAGVEIGQLRPEDGEASPDGIIESRVDLRVVGLSADRMQDFLARLESGPGIVIVRRLKMVRPYRKDVADLELTLTTFRLKG